MKTKSRFTKVLMLVLCLALMLLSCSEENPKNQLYADSCITSEDVMLEDGSIDETSSIEQKGLLIDENTFPDDVFRAFVLETADFTKDGYLSQYELKVSWDFYIRSDSSVGQSISSLKGLEVFTNLRELSISNVNIESLDVSGFKELYKLNISDVPLTELVLGNDILRELRISNAPIQSLDASGCSRLRIVDCHKTELEILNISECKHLERLYLRDNHIKSLDLSGLEFLSYVECPGNEIESLITTGCDRLTSLYCENNRLTELEVNHLKNLKYLGVAFNPLTVLDISKLRG